jgi:hypothetical protein
VCVDACHIRMARYFQLPTWQPNQAQPREVGVGGLVVGWLVGLSVSDKAPSLLCLDVDYRFTSYESMDRIDSSALANFCAILSAPCSLHGCFASLHLVTKSEDRRGDDGARSRASCMHT